MMTIFAVYQILTLRYYDLLKYIWEWRKSVISENALERETLDNNDDNFCRLSSSGIKIL